MLEEHPLITSLEAKVNELYQDRSIAQKVIGKNSSLLMTSTAIEEYIALKQDLSIPLGIRYLALSCIATNYQLYQNDREISQFKDIAGREIDIPTHAAIFNAIQIIKQKYCHIYECNTYEFDRVERLVKEISPELDEWGGSISSSTVYRHSKKDIKRTDVNKQSSTSSSTHSSDSVFTTEQVQTILAAERDKNFKWLLMMMGMLFVGGGVVISFAYRQQPQTIIVSTPQSTVTPASTVDSAPITIATPSPQVTSEPVTPSPTPIEIPSPQVSQDEAVSLVKKWLEAKKRLFAQPFDRDSAASITTEKAYTDKVRGPSSDGTPYSASQWLQKYGYYYSYGVQIIDRVNNFEVSGNEVVIDVMVTEDATLYNSKGERQAARSGLEQKIVRYVLIKDNGVLKVSDYNNLSSSSKRKI
jgi:ARC6-like, IMS domain